MTPIVPLAKQSPGGARSPLAAAVLASLILGLIALPSRASAICDNGYLCIYDWETDKWGGFAGSNKSWNMGRNNNWCHRADYYWNRGNTHTACVRQNANYTGRNVTLLRGQDTFDYYNFACSNYWRKPPKGC